MPKQSPYSLLSVLASGSWLTAERAKLYPLVFLTIQALAYLGLVLAGHGNLDAFGRPIGTDFASFWTASEFVLAGNAANAYHPIQHHAAQTALWGKELDYYAWLYPPTALLLVAPLGLLPYLASLFSWLAVTGAAYVATIWKFTPRAEALVPILGFPAAAVTNVAHGQNAFLSTAIVGIGLFISDRRPTAAGVLLGCLCYKPQLAPMLVIVSHFIGPKPMDLVFTPAEVLAVFVAVLITGQIASDGESNWLEGVQLLAVYVILAMVFFFLPDAVETAP